MTNPRMAAKTVMVLGAGSIGPGWGNGKAAAVLYAREGARVIAVDKEIAAAQETVGLIEEEGNLASAHAADVTDRAAVVDLVAKAREDWGALDVVHYNVGISLPGGVLEADPADWDAVFRVNLTGAFNVAQASLPKMTRPGGAFVFISSIAAIATGGYAYASYEASKAALNRLSRTIATTHAHEGIRSNVIMPGLMDTPHVTAMIAGRATSADDLAARRAAAPPMKRQGSPWDVARAALFLASDEAGYITGQELVVDGGLTLMVPPT